MKKLDLTLLKTFVANLETTVTVAAASFNENAEEVQLEYLSEMSKAAGLLLSVVQESNMLIGDIQRAIKYGSVPQQKLSDIQKMLQTQFYGPADDDEEAGGGRGGKGFGGGNFN